MPKQKIADLAPGLIGTKGQVARPSAASDNEPMNFKVSADFKQRFKMHAVRHRLRLNQLLIAMCESWERENGETPNG